MDNIKLEDSLRAIREECTNHISCGKCPLRKYNDDGNITCGVISEMPPSKWRLKNDCEGIPTLFV